MLYPICSWDPHRPIRGNRMDYVSHGDLENLGRPHWIRDRLDEDYHYYHSAA